jgi:hypothetical protein
LALCSHNSKVGGSNPPPATNPEGPLKSGPFSYTYTDAVGAIPPPTPPENPKNCAPINTDGYLAMPTRTCSYPPSCSARDFRLSLEAARGEAVN